MRELDRRLNAWRNDLADVRLAGKIAAGRFVAGARRVVASPVTSLRKEPRFDSPQSTEALLGEELLVFDEEEGWAFGQLARDSYVGYVAAGALSQVAAAATHKVTVPSTFLYPEPSIKAQPAEAVPMLAAVSVVAGEGNFARLADGRFAHLRHLAPVAENEADFVAVAGRFLNAPYYWGGKTWRGLDCSGLVQVALQACGIACPRDTDMQEKALGTALAGNGLDGLRRGDLVFWKGHVGIVADEATLLHASGHHMQVVTEDLREAVARIAASGSPVTSLKRL